MIKKLSMLLKLIENRDYKSIFNASLKYLIRIDRHLLVEINLSEYQPRNYKSRIDLTYKIDSQDQVNDIFVSWSDSSEEYRRHYEVYNDWGFQKCFVFREKNTGEVVHIQFLITYSDLGNVKKHLPRRLFQELKSVKDAYVHWTYTFEKYRWRGVAPFAMEVLLNYCKKNGIKKVYSHMSHKNKNSIGLCRRIGFEHKYNMIQIRHPAQDKHQGIFIKTKARSRWI